MRITKKSSIALSLLIACALLLGACSPGATPPPATEVPTTAPATEAPPAKVTGYLPDDFLAVCHRDTETRRIYELY